MLPPTTAWSRTRSRVRRWLHRLPIATALGPSRRPRLPLRLAAYGFFDAVGAFLRKLAAWVDRHDDLAPARAELRRQLDALQRAVAIEPAATVHAYADCATLGEHVISLLAGLEGLVGTAGSSATRRTCPAAVRPALLRLAEAYERWADALADQGALPAYQRVPWGCIPSSPPASSRELKASQHALVEASNAVILQLRTLVQASNGEDASTRAHPASAMQG